MSKVRRSLVAVATGLTMVTSIGVGLGAGAAHAAGGAQPNGWEVAAPVAVVNDATAADGCPIESPDGKALFFASMRGSGGDNDIWMASRSDIGSSFGAPTELPAPVNSDAQDFCPTPLEGGGLLFVSTRVGPDYYGNAACGQGDIYFTYPVSSTVWAEPRNLGCASNNDGPNGAGMEYGPSLIHTNKGTFLYFSTGDPVGAGTQDIYVSEVSGMQFGAPTAVAALNVAGVDDFMPNVSPDGREIVFASSRPGGSGLSDIYTSSSLGRSGKWREPVNLGGTVNTAAAESRPTLSADGLRLYFGRLGDIYVSQRASE